MNKFYEDEKPKRFNKRIKKRIAIGILVAASLTTVTACAVKFSHQEKTGKVIPIKFSWASANLKTKEGRRAAKQALVHEFCVALYSYKADIEKAIKNPNTDWTNQKQTIFSLDEGKVYVGGNNYTKTISSKEQAIAAIAEMETYLGLGVGPDADDPKLRTKFNNPFLERILNDVRDQLTQHGIDWVKS